MIETFALERHSSTCSDRAANVGLAPISDVGVWVAWQKCQAVLAEVP